MLFSKEYDSALWLILKSDKKYRKEIMDILHNMPLELYKSIQEKIIERNNRISENEEINMYDACDYIETRNGEIYGYDIRDDLTIYKGKKIDNNIRTTFSIILQELPNYEERFFEEWVGNIEANVNENEHIYSCDETEYNLYSNKILSVMIYGRNISIDYDKDRDTIPRIKIVNSKIIPDVTIENINKKILKK